MRNETYRSNRAWSRWTALFLMAAVAATGGYLPHFACACTDLCHGEAAPAAAAAHPASCCEGEAREPEPAAYALATDTAAASCTCPAHTSPPPAPVAQCDHRHGSTLKSMVVALDVPACLAEWNGVKPSAGREAPAPENAPPYLKFCALLC